MSDLYRLEHADELRIAESCFLCHIHAGSETCRDCEPGVVKPQYSSSKPGEKLCAISVCAVADKHAMSHLMFL